MALHFCSNAYTEPKTRIRSQCIPLHSFAYHTGFCYAFTAVEEVAIESAVKLCG